MFNADNLEKIAGAKGSGFSIWHYKAPDRVTADQARNMLGFFPMGTILAGDAIYVEADGQATHHYAAFNKHENKMSLCLLGG